MAPAPGLIPRFSIITPVWNTPVAVLRATVASVRSQSEGSWQHCMVDDASTDPDVWPELQRMAAADPRISIARREQQGGIVAASNDALGLARADWLVLLDHDDLLTPDALESIAHAIDLDPEVDYVYSDEDKVDAEGRRSGAMLKPDWSPDRLRTQMYTCHASAHRRSLVEEVGGFHEGFEGSQDWDLALRVTERARSVAHVPKILYSWRVTETSTASSPDAKPWAYEAGRRAIEAHCARTGFEATVRHDDDPTRTGVYHLEPALSSSPPVSIVIPTRGTAREVRGATIPLVTNCVQSIAERSTYDAFEIVVVLDDDSPAELADELEALAAGRLRIVWFDRPFSFSEKINVGALHADCDHLLLLNDDTEVITHDWIQRLVMYSQHDGIGAVGAKLLYEDGRLQHVGLASDGGGFGHVYHGFSPDYRGYIDNVLVAGNYLAVTGACIMTPRDVFEAVGGLSRDLPLNYNDVDYCLKVWQHGGRVVYDPDTVLYHFESATRETRVRTWEHELLTQRWSHVTQRDRFVAPALTGGIHHVPPVQFSDGSLL